MRESRPTDTLAGLLRRRILLTGDLILAEGLQGFRHKRDMEAARHALLSLPYADMVGQEVALRSAQNHRLLRQRGVTARKTVDVIATFCLRYGHVLLHDDRDFEPMRESISVCARCKPGSARYRRAHRAHQAIACIYSYNRVD